MADDLKQVLTTYEGWLLRQPLAKNTQQAYRFHVRQYGDYLATRYATGDDPIHDPFARDYAVRDYKRYLKSEWRGINAWKPPVATVYPHSRIVKAPWKDYT